MEKEKLYSWSKNGMKMIINSDFKTFNNQTNCISRGQTIANTQYSNHIRPYREIECNGIINEKGHLRDYDLQFFGKGCSSWSMIRDYVKSITTKDGCMLYEFFYYKKGGYDNQRVVIGYIIEQNGKYKIIQTDFLNKDKKINTLKLCRDIIEN